MFKIRKEHMIAFREEGTRDFEKRVVAHIHRCFPEQWARLGEGEARGVIRLGIERAAVFGIVGEQDVCKFIDLMLVFGVDFDRRCEWAREILDGPARGDGPTRMGALHERALEVA